MVGLTSEFGVMPAALGGVDKVWEEKGVEIALVPQRAAGAGPILASSVVATPIAGDISEVDIMPERGVASGSPLVTFWAEDSVIGKIPSRRRGPITIRGAAIVERKGRPIAPPKGWGSEFENGRRKVKAALLVLRKLSFADVRAFGTEEGNTHSTSIFICPNGKHFDARHILRNGKRAKACGRGA